MSRFEQEHGNGNSMLTKQCFEELYRRFTAVVLLEYKLYWGEAQ